MAGINGEYGFLPKLPKARLGEYTSMGISSNAKNLIGSIAMAVLTTFPTPAYADSKENRGTDYSNACGDIIVPGAYCDSGVYKTNIPVWDLNITDLKRYFIELQSDEISIDAVKEMQYYIEHATSDEFLKRMIPLFDDIFKESGVKILGRDMFLFIQFHQFFISGEYEMARDTLENIIFTFSEIIELPNILHKHGFYGEEV